MNMLVGSNVMHKAIEGSSRIQVRGIVANRHDIGKLESYIADKVLALRFVTQQVDLSRHDQRPLYP